MSDYLYALRRNYVIFILSLRSLLRGSGRCARSCALNAVMMCGVLIMNVTIASEQQIIGSSGVTLVSAASLPMYEVSDVMKKADDVFWSRLREELESQGVNVPEVLERSNEELIDTWQRPGLFLSQTCGYPYVHTLNSQGVKIVGTPVYTTNDGLPAGEYRSVIIVNAGAPYKTLAGLKGKVAGVNEMSSNSGMNVFRATVASAFSKNELERGVFASVIVTGGHMKSMEMVADGQIDVASIDSVSFDLIKRDYPELAAKTRILMETSPSPGLPMITGSSTDDATIYKLQVAIKKIIKNQVDDELRGAIDTMKLKDFVVISSQTYEQRIRQLEAVALDKGYPALK